MSHLKTKSLAEYASAARAEKEKPFRDALLFAKSEAHTDSGRAFVKSCEEQFERKGYLTEKQVTALYGVDSEPNPGHDYYDEDHADDVAGVPNFDDGW